ncbi:CgeB family protein [Halorientalis marina]|uniref:CgeB family protein n=1 Tax=Halorientalis marina TaxID=2931976 RepID=UPI001FF3E401|nr:glycosyltransferase [Halorientalis marina]
MQILIYGKTRQPAIELMCGRAFTKLGHKVAYASRAGPKLLGDYRLKTLPKIERTPLYEPLVKYNARRRAELIDPDLVFVMKGSYLDSDAVRRLRKVTGAPVVSWNQDNPFQVRSEHRRDETYLDAITEYDIVYTWGRHLIDDFLAAGARQVEHLPFAHDPVIHHPTETVPKYDCEVAFIGQWSPKRERVLSALTGFNLQIRGLWWAQRCEDETLRQCVEGESLAGEEYARAMSSADAVVNVVGDHNVPFYNMRTFEIPAVQSLMLTTRTEGQEEVFPDGEACLMFSDPEDLRTAAESALEKPHRLRAIADRGYEIAQQHTYEHRMRTVLEDV